MNDRLQAAGLMLARRVPQLIGQLQTRFGGRFEALRQRPSARKVSEWVQRIPGLADLLDLSRRWTREMAEQPVTSGHAHTEEYERDSEPSTAALLGTLHSAPDFEERVSVVRALGRRGGGQETAGLISALRDPSVEVACAAAEQLGRVAPAMPNARAALWQVIDNRDGYYNAIVRGAALAALGSCVAESELASVFRLIEDLDAEVSVAAIGALLSRAPQQAPTYLVPVLVNAQGYYLPIVRLASARALERSGALGSHALADLVQRESDPQVRAVLQRRAASPLH